MKEFNLEDRYKFYLEKVGLDESKMHIQQKTETKRAFYGACGQMLVMMRDEVGALDEDEAIEVMQDMINQVGIFWNNERN